MKLPCLIFFFILSSSILATTYYVSSSAGDDGNTGSTPATAFATVSKGIDTITTGDSLLFKRGDEWKGVVKYIERNGTPGANIYIGAYGAGPLPIIDNRDTLAGAALASNWIEVAGIWQMDWPNNKPPGRLYLDGVEHLRAPTLATLGLTDTEGEPGHWFFTDSTLYIVNTQNPALAYSSIVGSKEFYTLLFAASSYIQMDSLEIQGAYGPGIWLNNAHHFTIQNCRFGAGGESGLFLNNGSDYNIISENDFDSAFEIFHGLGTARGCGDGIRLRDDASHNSILNNTFKNWAHNAIELVNDTIPQVGTNYNVIKNNFISAPDIPYAHPLGADGGYGDCQFNEFAYNRIDSFRTANQINGNNNWIHHNIISNAKQSPAKNAVTAHAFLLGVYQFWLVCRDNIYEQNYIGEMDEAAFSIRNFGFAGQTVSNLIIRNNVIVNTGKSPYNSGYDQGTAFVVNEDFPLEKIFFINNLIYNTIPNAPLLHRVIGNQYFDLSAFNALQDSLTIYVQGNIAADPLLDLLFTPADNSPCVNHGVLPDSTGQLDYYQMSRIVDGKIDIGPVENQNTCNANATVFININAVGNNTGHNWTDAKTSLLAGLNTCPTTSPRTFWVAAGTYLPSETNDRDAHFRLPSNHELYGGFNGDELALAQRDIELNATWLSGDLGTPNDTSDNSYQLIYQHKDSAVIYDGIRLTRANSGAGQAAIHLDSSQLILKNSTVTENYGIDYAALLSESSLLELSDSHFYQNSCTTPYPLFFDTNSISLLNNNFIEQGIWHLGNLTLNNCYFKLPAIEDIKLNGTVLLIEENKIER